MSADVELFNGNLILKIKIISILRKMVENMAITKIMSIIWIGYDEYQILEQFEKSIKIYFAKQRIAGNEFQTDQERSRKRGVIEV